MATSYILHHDWQEVGQELRRSCRPAANKANMKLCRRIL